MTRAQRFWLLCLVFVAVERLSLTRDARLPEGAEAVWDIGKTYRERTPTRERLCINGLGRNYRCDV